MALMLLLKRREVMSGKESFISRIGSGVDHVFQGAHSRIKLGLSYMNRRTFAALAHWIAYHILLRVRRVYVEAKSKTLSTPQGKKLIDAVRGRGEVRDHGASFYLRRISADHPVK